MISSEIKIYEIRVGNWMLVPEVDSPFKIPIFKARVQAFGIFGNVEFFHTPQIIGVSVPLRQISGIPITEEILLKAGFKYNLEGWIPDGSLSLENIKIVPQDNGFAILVNGACISIIYFLHQLQNIFNDLFKRELEVNFSHT